MFLYLIYVNFLTKIVNVRLMDNKSSYVKFVLCETLIYYNKIVVKTIDNKEINRNFKLRPFVYNFNVIGTITNNFIPPQFFHYNIVFTNTHV